MTKRQHVFPQPSDTIATKAQGHSTFIARHRSAIFTQAATAYQAHGRGALVVHESEVQGSEATFRYLPLDNPLGWPDAETRLLAETYDPHRQIVVVFTGPAGFVTAYMLGIAPITNTDT